VAGITVNEQIFGEAVYESKTFETNFADGILGLGFSALSEFEQPSVFDNMVKEKLVPAPVFSMYISRISDEPKEKESMLTLGGTNPDYYTGDFTFVDVLWADYWEFKMDAVNLANKAGFFCVVGCFARVDTGATLILGPMREVTNLNKKLGGTRVENSTGMFSFNCSRVSDLPDVHLIINGKTFSFSNKEYVIKSKENCYSAFCGMTFPRDTIPYWVLGTTFIRSYYTQFDKENHRIGFAKAKH
ncbi:cathepsin d, partial [Plakobranchus ocellatus]